MNLVACKFYLFLLSGTLFVLGNNAFRKNQQLFDARNVLTSLVFNLDKRQTIVRTLHGLRKVRLNPTVKKTMAFRAFLSQSGPLRGKCG